MTKKPRLIEADVKSIEKTTPTTDTEPNACTIHLSTENEENLAVNVNIAAEVVRGSILRIEGTTAFENHRANIVAVIHLDVAPETETIGFAEITIYS